MSPRALRCSNVLAIALVCVAAGACHESRYAGDGTLTDNRFSPSERFVLNLGPTDLAKAGVATYRLAGLPEDSFTFGLEVTGGSSTDKPLYEARPITAIVRFTLTDERARVIIDEVGPLNEWVWSGSPHERVAFVYRGGVSRDVPMPGYVSPQPVGVKSDGGWGSGFSPRSEGRYSLKVQVLKEDPYAGAFTVTLKGATGGWE